jgi:hypothetical protein
LVVLVFLAKVFSLNVFVNEIIGARDDGCFHSTGG